MFPFLLPLLGGIGALMSTAAPAATLAAPVAAGAAATGIGSMLPSLGSMALPAAMMGGTLIDRMMAPEPDKPDDSHRNYKLNRHWDPKTGTFKGGYDDAGLGHGLFSGDVKMFANGGVVQGEQYDPMQAGIASLQSGGGQSEMRQVDKQIVQQALMALTGQIPPEQPISLFMQRFGRPALADLAKKVVEMEGQNKQGMMIAGPGDGQSDEIPAQAGQMPVRLSNGEFVLPARTVSALGNGSTDAGAKELHNMIRRVDQERHGSTQPPRLNPAQYMPG